ncbi:MAG: hypothetical protein N3J91_04385 [Verrucomicrobiae bacterium]|nr:hypothetical protein [Verrucomicrobiae bacterium]
MKTTMKNLYRSHARQMELGLPSSANLRHTPRRQRRLPGAHWWFQQMRQAVLNAPGPQTDPVLREAAPALLTETSVDPTRS